jgi:peptidoglycan/LPS O-acetylase OafA/YrhL
MTALAVFAVIVSAAAGVLWLVDRTGRRRARRQRFYVSKRCLRVFDPSPSHHPAQGTRHDHTQPM